MSDDQEMPVPFPTQGMNRIEVISDQPEGTTPEGVNVRACDPETGRLRGASRPGLSQFIGAVAGADYVQGMEVVTTMSADALLGEGRFLRYGYTEEATGYSLSFLAGELADPNDSGAGSFGYTRDVSSDTFPYPPVYPRKSEKQFRVDLTADDDNSRAGYVDGVSTKQVTFTSAQAAASHVVTPGDFEAITFNLTGTVYEIKAGSPVRRPDLDFSFTTKTNWQLPFFAYQTSNGKVGFKNNTQSTGVTATGAFTMAALVTGSSQLGTATTYVAYPKASATSGYTDCGICSYAGTGTPDVTVSAVLGIARTTWSCCSDGTAFYCAGISTTGGTFIARVTTAGAITWSNSNAGPYSLGHAPGAPTNVDNDTQGSSCVVSGTTLYVNIPQYGVAKYATSDGSLIGTLVTNATLASGGYINATDNFEGRPPMMAVANGFLAVPMQTSAKGYSSGCTHGLAIVDLSSGSVVARVTGLGPSAYPLSVVSDGTAFYVLVPEDSLADVNTAVVKKYGTDGALAWSSSPFASQGANSNNREVLLYISGSQQLLAGNNYETKVMATDGTTSRSVAALSAPPEWITDAGAA